MATKPKLPAGITITPCDEPPRPDCKPGTWWHYEVVTRSGRNQMSGYMVGRRPEVERRAKALLAHMREIEGDRTTRSAWRTQPNVPDGHDLATCGCMTCHNMRRRAAMEKRTQAGRESSALIFGANRGSFV